MGVHVYVCGWGEGGKCGVGGVECIACMYTVKACVLRGCLHCTPSHGAPLQAYTFSSMVVSPQETRVRELDGELN